MNSPVLIPIDKLKAHPKNPRLSYREDVIEGIVANLNGEMLPRYSLSVRPIADGFFEIVSGHHRWQAALRKGYATLPCWVTEMSDDEAYMALVTDNAQGELASLEIGLHALEVVGKGKRGRGNKGDGIKSYAELIAKPRSSVSEWVSAAEVAKCVERSTHLLPYTHCLVAVHSLPASLWPAMVEALLAAAQDPKTKWSVEKTQSFVDDVKDFLENHGVPEEDRDWLPPDELAIRMIEDKATDRKDKISVSRVGRLLRMSEDLLAHFHAEQDRLEKRSDEIQEAVRPTIPSWTESFKEWRLEKKGHASWIHQGISQWRIDHDDEVFALEEEIDRILGSGAEANFTLICSDFRKAEVADESIDAIVTDPPYGKKWLPIYRDLGVFADRVLKPGGIMAVMTGNADEHEIHSLLAESVAYRCTLYYLMPGTATVQLFDVRASSEVKPILVFHKGEMPKDAPWLRNKCVSPSGAKSRYVWEQSEEGMAAITDQIVTEGSVVLDPFVGVGTTGVVCLQKNCQFIGIDIDKKRLATSEKRLQAACSQEAEASDIDE